MRHPVVACIIGLCLALGAGAASGQDNQNQSQDGGGSRDDRADVRLDYVPLRLPGFDSDVARRIVVVSEGQLFAVDLAGHVLQRSEDRIDLGSLIGSVTRFAYNSDMFVPAASLGSVGLVSNTLILNFGVPAGRRPWLDDGVLARLGGAVAPKPVVTVPPLETRSVRTVVVMNDASTFVIGGLIQHVEPEEPARLFADIPIIGEMFNVFNTDTNSNEVLVLIRPSIITD